MAATRHRTLRPLQDKDLGRYKGQPSRSQWGGTASVREAASLTQTQRKVSKIRGMTKEVSEWSKIRPWLTIPSPNRPHKARTSKDGYPNSSPPLDT